MNSSLPDIGDVTTTQIGGLEIRLARGGRADGIPILNMNAWEDAKFVAAVKATGRKRLVMGGIVTSVYLAFAASDALADGFEVSFVVDAVGGTYKECHDTAVLRLTRAGAVPRTTSSMIAEWFRDWKSPLAEAVRTIYPPYYEELAALKQAPQSHAPTGLVRR